MPKRLLLTSCWCVATSVLSCAAAATTPAQLAHFEEQIRPLLVLRCGQCHNANDAEFAGNLRLDYSGGWLAGGDSGAAVDVTHPAASLMLRAIGYDDPDLQMPPKSKLPAREIALLRDWIADGAPAPDEEPSAIEKANEFDLEARRAAHWAWQPVTRPEVPFVHNEAWPRDDIDKFILARLEQASLTPADEVDPAAWHRRVTFDLTGLPPSSEEVEVFMSDTSEMARAGVVDRLLASQAFAECWAQHWLDLVRFAETKGHESDYELPHAWRYRDYVIRAVAANVPHDDFIVEHIAGDLLANPRVDKATRTNQSIQATGFWHLSEATHSPVDIRGEEAARVDNQIDVFGKAFLGLTVACARCHDHKFDAISTADYYALCGFIQSSSYQEANIADPEKHAKIVAQLEELNRDEGGRVFQAYVAVLAANNARVTPEVTTESEPWQLPKEALTDVTHPAHLLATLVGQTVESERSRIIANYIEAAAAPVEELAGNVIVDFSRTDFNSRDQWLTSGWSFGNGPTRIGDIVLSSDWQRPIARVIETPSASSAMLSPKLTGLYRTPTFAITAPNIWYRYRGQAAVFLDVDSHRTVQGPLHQVCSQKLKKTNEPTWFRHPAGDYLGHHVHVDFKPEGDFELLAVVVADSLPTTAPRPNATIARVVAERSAESNAEVQAAFIEAMRQAHQHVRDGKATAADARLVNWQLGESFRKRSTEWPEPFARARTLFVQQREQIEASIPEPQWALALLDGDGVDEYVHLRGSHKNLAEEPTPRRFLAALGGEFAIPHGSGRFELARRVVDQANPLAARVHVNRVWAYLTGRGIVKTVDNFGVLGEPPTHPELLDYLADEFVQGGWDTKSLIRRIVLSSSYRQSCDVSDAAREIDPANSLLHASRLRRISAEAIRDSLLAISGQLDIKSYGPSVRIHITDFMRHNRSPDWSGPLDGDRRRSIYVEVRRNAMSHFLGAFDRPQPFTTVGLRHTSNSPVQPLTMLNDPLVHELTGKWAEQLVEQFDTDEAAVNAAYIAAFARPATVVERGQIVDFVAATEDREQAWRDVCLALVNGKEFVLLR